MARIRRNINISGGLLDAELRRDLDKFYDNLRRDLKAGAPVRTGRLRRETASIERRDGLSGALVTPTEYASYVEYGTRYQRARRYHRVSDGRIKELKGAFSRAVGRKADRTFGGLGIEGLIEVSVKSGR